MIKIQAQPQVLAALSQAFPPPTYNATRALDKYIAALERLLFASLQVPRNPMQSKLNLYAIPLQRLANSGGQIGPRKVRVHKWLRDNHLELVQAVTTGSNQNKQLSQVRVTHRASMTDGLNPIEQMRMNNLKLNDREIAAYLTGDDATNQGLFDLLYPDYRPDWSDEYIHSQFDPIKVDVQSLENYIVWLSQDARLLSKDKKATALRSGQGQKAAFQPQGGVRRGGQKLGQEARRRFAARVNRYGGGIDRGQFVLSGQVGHQLHAGCDQDFSHLRATDWALIFGLRHGPHRGIAVGKRPQARCDRVGNAQLLQHFLEMDARRGQYRVGQVNRIRGKQGGAQRFGVAHPRQCGALLDGNAGFHKAQIGNAVGQHFPLFGKLGDQCLGEY